MSDNHNDTHAQRTSLHDALDALGQRVRDEPDAAFETRLRAAALPAPVVARIGFRPRGALAAAAVVALAATATTVVLTQLNPGETEDPAALATALEADLDVFLALEDVFTLPARVEVAALDAETDALATIGTALDDDWASEWTTDWTTDWTEAFDEPTG